MHPGYHIFLSPMFSFIQPNSVSLLILQRSKIEHSSPHFWPAKHIGRKTHNVPGIFLLIRETEECTGLFLKLHHIKLKYQDIFTWISAMLQLSHSAYVQLILNPKWRTLYFVGLGLRLNLTKITLNLMLSVTTLAVFPDFRSLVDLTCRSFPFLSPSVTKMLKGLGLDKSSRGNHPLPC